MANPRKKLLPFGVGRALDSITQVDKRGLLYHMDYKADYYKLEKYVDLITKPGCSTFLTRNKEGEVLFARNYDICHWKNNERGEIQDVTGLILVVNCANRKAKYKSLGMVDAFWLDVHKGRFYEGCLSDGKTNTTIMAVAPFAIMDGINECGLAVSIMHLPTENDWQSIEYIDPDSIGEDKTKPVIVLTEAGEEPKRLDSNVKKDSIAINTTDKKAWKVNKNLSVHQTEPGKKTMIHPVLMRRMLDFCKDVDEAVELAKSVNVQSPLPDNDYHIMVSDSDGNSVILEWVNNELVVSPAVNSTNYYLTREDKYGYGHDRYELIDEHMEKCSNVMSEDEAMNLLYLASQNGPEGRFTAFTQWTSLYNLDKGTMKLTVFTDFDNVYEYSI